MTIITKPSELHKLPVGSQVVTGLGYVYTKQPGGVWWNRYALRTPAAWLLDPEHSLQPIRVLSEVQP